MHHDSMMLHCCNVQRITISLRGSAITPRPIPVLVQPKLILMFTRRERTHTSRMHFHWWSMTVQPVHGHQWIKVANWRSIAQHRWSIVADLTGGHAGLLEGAPALTLPPLGTRSVFSRPWELTRPTVSMSSKCFVL